MADKGQYDDLHRMITKECAKLQDYIVSLDKQISEQIMHLESTKSEEELAALKAGLRTVQKSQDEVKMLILEGLKELLAKEDGVKDSLNEWQMNFGIFSEDLGEPESCSKDEETYQKTSELEAKESRNEGVLEKMIESGLSQQSSRLKLEVYANIEASEQKIEELMRECKEGFKKDSDSGKKSLKVFLKSCRGLLDHHEEVKALKAIDMNAGGCGNRLCCLLIDFLFMMSRQENLAAKIERLRSALRCVAEDKNSIFIVQLFKALEMVATEFRRMKTIEVTRKRNLEAMENPELDDMASNRKSTPEELSENFLEQILYQLLDQFVMVAAHLESIVSHPSLIPAWQMPRKEEVSMLQGGLTQCLKDLDWIKSCISQIEAVAIPLLPLNDPKTREVRRMQQFHICGGPNFV
ncbi:hypothetical protein CJ030_MR7G001004 [Morella rubra]|uniref:Uncharacterized protein n=1 Tax=Morella rubra TaxID=262757 RepID=A0A6A1V7C5_9ROSI|nr:hypothetical protein CJ030_MR7G001004 [Morella rubra]